MKLPNGITGFSNSKINIPPQIDSRQFKQLCNDFASHNSGKVIDFITPQYHSSFYYAQVVLKNRFYILLNKHYPYLAFASVVEFGNIIFIERPVFNEQFASFYLVIGADELNIPLHQNLIKNSELNSVEMEQIDYWKPETLGQIIFNYWA